MSLLLSGLLFAADTPNPSNSAVALLNAGRVDELISSLQKQNTAQAHNLMGRAYYAEEKTDDAIKEGEKSIEMAPNNSNYHLWLGRFYGQKAEHVNPLRAAGLAGKVRDQFEKAVQLDGGNTAARSDLAEFYIDAPGMMGGGADKAKGQIQAITAKDAAKADFLKAKLAEKAKDYASAEKEYKAAIAADKGSAEAWLNLASYYKDRANTAGMLDAVKKVEAAPHKNAAVFSDAADLLLQSNKSLSLAVDLAKKYLNAADKSEEAPAFKTHYILGEILRKQGDKAGAVKEFQAALAMAKDYEPAKKAASGS